MNRAMDIAVTGTVFHRMEWLSPLQKKYVNLAVRTISCGSDGRGLVVALKSVVRSLRAIDGVRHVPGLTRHIAEFSAAAVDNLIAWDKLPSHWRVAPSLNSKSAAYSLWFQKPEERHGPEGERRSERRWATCLSVPSRAKNQFRFGREVSHGSERINP
jgi:hypothetical protein